MQPVLSPSTQALLFTSAIFSMNKQAVSEAIADNVEFISNATLVDQEGKETQDKRSFAGKELVINVLAQRLFDITESVTVKDISLQESQANPLCARVGFRTIEAKREGSALATYEYNGSYLLYFTETADKVYKVSQVQLQNTRTTLP